MVNNFAYGDVSNTGFGGSFGQGSNCLCSLPMLVILILIILQFSRNNGYSDKECYDED